MKIDEVSKKYGLSKDTLRYYEKIELISKVKKDKSGNSVYGKKEFERIRFICCMRKQDYPLNK